MADFQKWIIFGERKRLYHPGTFRQAPCGYYFLDGVFLLHYAPTVTR